MPERQYESDLSARRDLAVAKGPAGKRATGRLAYSRTGMQRLPLRLMLAYFIGTILVFAFGPVDYPIDNWPSLIAFLSAVLIALWVGYRVGAGGRATGRKFKAWRRVFTLGAVAAVVLMFPAAYLYAGKMPWQVFEAARDQAQAYSDFQQNLLFTTQGDRAVVALTRAAFAPLVLASVPLGLLHWRELSLLQRALLGAAILSSVILSFLRGTDREIADLIIVIFSTLLVVVMRRAVKTNKSILTEITRHRTAVFITVLCVALATALFVERKQGRAGGANPPCVGELQLCADYDYPLFRPLDDEAKFALSMASLYLGQGYYGLSLALAKPFQSTWGLGHSMALMAYFSSFTGDEGLYERSYTFRLRGDGWSDLSQWSTLFPWLANDVGFYAVPFVVGLLAWLWGASWKDAVFQRNDRAAIVFVFMMIVVFYMPANNQLAQTMDGYIAALFWIGLWLIDRARAKRQTASRHGAAIAA